MKVLKGFLMLALCLLFGCGETPRDLGHGYYYMKLNRYDRVITKKLDSVFEPVVETNVIEYKVLDGVVFGLRQASEVLNDSKNLISKNYGYFILDMTTGQLLEGLGLTELEKYLDTKY